MLKSRVVVLTALLGAGGVLLGAAPAAASDAAPAGVVVERTVVAPAPTAADRGPIVAAPPEKVIGEYPTQRACNEAGRRLGGESYRCARNQHGDWMLIVPRV